jgi:hypothetical protein
MDTVEQARASLTRQKLDEYVRKAVAEIDAWEAAGKIDPAAAAEARRQAPAVIALHIALHIAG